MASNQPHQRVVNNGSNGQQQAETTYNQSSAGISPAVSYRDPASLFRRRHQNQRHHSPTSPLKTTKYR
uniref:Uncharacterized protein n=1 Tax=Solanum lycopersicum TaxID=4081 RepID=A0A3Q7GHM6_SOLLC